MAGKPFLAMMLSPQGACGGIGPAVEALRFAVAEGPDHEAKHKHPVYGWQVLYELK